MDTGSLGGTGEYGDERRDPRWPTESEAQYVGETSRSTRGSGADQARGAAGQPTGSSALRHWRERLGRPPRPHPAAVPDAPSPSGGGGESPNRIDTDTARGPAAFSVDEFTRRLREGPMSELYSGEVRQSEGSGEHASPPRESGPSEPDHAVDKLVAAAVPAQAGRDRPRRPPDTVRKAEAPEEPSGLVRPYFRTKGRTKPAHDLAIETLVSTSEHGRVLDQVRVPEHRSICELCLDTRSVAEVAAHLRLPLGVVRVLIADVTGLGLVRVHSGSSLVGDRPSLEFMERVLSGLRRI